MSRSIPSSFRLVQHPPQVTIARLREISQLHVPRPVIGEEGTLNPLQS